MERCERVGGDVRRERVVNEHVKRRESGGGERRFDDGERRCLERIDFDAHKWVGVS